MTEFCMIMLLLRYVSQPSVFFAGALLLVLFEYKLKLLIKTLDEFPMKLNQPGLFLSERPVMVDR